MRQKQKKWLKKIQQVVKKEQNKSLPKNLVKSQSKNNEF